MDNVVAKAGRSTSEAALSPMPPWRIWSVAGRQPVLSKRTLHFVEAAVFRLLSKAASLSACW